MHRRRFLTVVGCGMLATRALAEGQQAAKVPRVGVLSPGAASRPNLAVDAFRQGLRELGYVEGQNVILEIRWAEDTPQRYPELVAELVRGNVDVIVGPSGTIPAAKQATTTIPIVMTTGGDPVETGLVRSLGRPGGNITGLTLVVPGVAGKRLELLKEAAPGIARIAALWHPGYSLSAETLKETETAARALGLQLQPLRVQREDDFDGAFRALVDGGAQAVITTQGPLFSRANARIAELGLKHRLPTMSGETGFAEAGGLMNYGPNVRSNWRRAASYVDKIIKGAKPVDLPIEQPAKLDFIINLKTAKALGLSLPTSLLLRADQVVE